ncbi:MAG: recombinase family protein [Candidatus Sericytochromatia bacterium]|nr:recombinase family protein [Candidatus Sericytochromatia bacterium]
MTPRFHGYIWLSPEDASRAERVTAARSTLEAYCDANGLKLSEVHVETSHPGSALERPILSKLIDEPNVVLVMPSLNSLGRRFHDVATVLSEFAHREVRLISIAEGVDTSKPEGMQLIRVLVRIPQVAGWIKPIKAPAASKVFVRAREVLHNGGTCPFGYTLDEGTNQFVVNEREAPVVQRIFRERSAGRSLRQIAGDLSKDGIPTKRGGRWQANTVKTILENIFYTGDYQCQNKVFERDHEPIISKELFNEVNSSKAVLQVL